jgi:type I restriction enzyme R subunit
LLVGVADDGSVHGLDADYVTLHKAGHDDRDRFVQHVAQIVTTSMGAAAATKQTQFFVRVANATKALDGDEKQKYLSQRWPAPA